jgi:transcriptional regulator with XRE-family HTH domain
MEKGWSASELARRAGIARSHISRIESGERPRPSADVLHRLAEALETSVADLLEQPAAVSVTELPASLRRLAEREQLPAEDVAMLAAIRYRGEQPRSVAGWAFVLEAVRLAILDPADDAEDA